MHQLKYPVLLDTLYDKDYILRSFNPEHASYLDAEVRDFLVTGDFVPNIFVTNTETIRTNVELLETPKRLNLPFATCIFESLNEPLYCISTEDKEHPQIQVQGIFVHELEEGYGVFLIDSKKTVFGVGTKGNYDNTLKILSIICKNINSKEACFGEAKQNERFKRKALSLVKIKKVICISNKKNQSKMTAAIVGGIDWSHAWEVRGHWRALKGVGKNREGTYCISGMTWVTPYIKGPEEKELIKKVRVNKEKK